jgi:hypothetical protein
MRTDIKKCKRIKIKSNLDMVGPAMDNFGQYPIFSQPILPPNLDDARVKDKLEALDLSLGIPNKKNFINHDGLDAKGRRARREEVENEDEEEQIEEENQEADPKAFPGKEVKPLKYSKKDKFTTNLEINLDLEANAQIKAAEAIKQGQTDIGFWHLQNASDFIRNAHALANLKRIEIRDPTAANAVKS